MKIWARIWKDNHMIRDYTVVDEQEDTRTHKVFRALEEICHHFDLGQPIWLDSSVREFQKHSRVRFGRDSFIEAIDFDYLDLMVLEED